TIVRTALQMKEILLSVSRSRSMSVEETASAWARSRSMAFAALSCCLDASIASASRASAWSLAFVVSSRVTVAACRACRQTWVTVVATGVPFRAFWESSRKTTLGVRAECSYGQARTLRETDRDRGRGADRCGASAWRSGPRDRARAWLHAELAASVRLAGGYQAKQVRRRGHVRFSRPRPVRRRVHGRGQGD